MTWTLHKDDQGTEFWLELPCDWRAPERARSFQVFKRSSDGFGQLLPRPSEDDVKSFYDVPYYTHETEVETFNTTGFHWKVLRHIAWRLDNGAFPDKGYWANLLGQGGKRVLDIGCGAGNMIAPLTELGHDVIGVEPDASARAVAQDKGFTVFEGTAEDMPPELSGERFDAVLMFHVLEHCLNPDAALKAAFDTLAPGGILIAEVPNNDCMGLTLFGRNWYWLDVPRHLNFFTTRTLSALFADCDIAIHKTQHWGFQRQFNANWVAMQSQIATVFGAKPAGFLTYLRAFVFMAFATPQRKFDSVRLVAVRGS